MKKDNSGFSLIELLILVAIILVIAATVIPPIINLKWQTNFKIHFGIEGVMAWKDDGAARQTVQPLVTKRLGELNAARKQACQEPACANPAVTPEEVQKRLNELNDARAKCAQAQRAESDAVLAAKHFGFSADAANTAGGK